MCLEMAIIVDTDRFMENQMYVIKLLSPGRGGPERFLNEMMAGMVKIIHQTPMKNIAPLMPSMIWWKPITKTMIVEKTTLRVAPE